MWRSNLSPANPANGTIAAATTAEKGNSFNFTVTPSTGYDISKVYYKVGNGDYQELTGSNGSYTIAGSSITDNITLKREVLEETGIIIEIISKKHLSASEMRWFSSGYETKNSDSAYNTSIGDDIYYEN